MSKNEEEIEIKNIRSQSDIETLQKTGCAEAVVVLISNYFSRLMGVYGDDYNASEGFCILLEQGDPITDKKFLENELCIRGEEDLVSVTKEFVDYDPNVGIFTILCIFSADFAMSYWVPNEPWVGRELLHQLNNFQNFSGDNGE